MYIVCPAVMPCVETVPPVPSTAPLVVKSALVSSALGGMVAGCAGVLLAPITFINSNVGLALGLKAFPAAVLGGFGSIPGALVGGLIIGVIEVLSGFYLAQGWKDVAPYLVLLVMLLVKPEGLFGALGRKKV